MSKHQMYRWQKAFIPLDELRLVTPHTSPARLELSFDSDPARYHFRFEGPDERDEAMTILCDAWEKLKEKVPDTNREERNEHARDLEDAFRNFIMNNNIEKETVDK